MFFIFFKFYSSPRFVLSLHQCSFGGLMEDLLVLLGGTFGEQQALSPHVTIKGYWSMQKRNRSKSQTHFVSCTTVSKKKKVSCLLVTQQLLSNTSVHGEHRFHGLQLPLIPRWCLSSAIKGPATLKQTDNTTTTTSTTEAGGVTLPTPEGNIRLFSCSVFTSLAPNCVCLLLGTEQITYSAWVVGVNQNRKK